MDTADSGLDGFFEAYWKDFDAGQPLPLGDYIDRWPAERRRIEAEYLSLERERIGVEKDPVAASGELSGTLGPYKLVRPLGEGGQGVVYLAEDPRLGRQIALKVLQGVGPIPDAVLQRFRREAAVAARLELPGVCPVYDAGVEGNVPYMAMRYVEGESLADHLRRLSSEGEVTEEWGASESTFVDSLGQQDPITPSREDADRLLLLMERAARIVHGIHEASVLHRDLKPGNIMVTPDGEPVVMDFGFARLDDQALSVLTHSGDLFGTPAYMSPEQLGAKLHELDRRTDVWSLGVMLYECLTFTRPFHGATRNALYDAIRGTEPRDPLTLNPDLPLPLKTVIATALQKSLNHRYQSAEELADDLARVRRREPIAATPPGAFVRLGLWARREPRVVAAVGAAFGILVVGLITALVLLGQVRDRESKERASRQLAQEEQKRAEEERGRAEIASQNLRDEQAQAQRLIADRAMRSGRWQEALTALDRAEELRHPDPVSIALDRAVALDANLQPQRATEVLRALDPETLPVAARARHDFLSGELLSTIDEKRRALMKAAVASGTLAPADEAYARAVMAERLPDAMKFIDTALDADPAHVFATGAKGSLLLFGSGTEASEDWVARWKALRPQDPQLTIYRAFVRAMSGAEDAAEPLDALRDRFLAKDLAYLLELVEVVEIVGQLGRAAVQNLKGNPVPVETAKLKKVIRRALRRRESPGSENLVSLLQRPLPVVRREVLAFAEGMLRENERFSPPIQRFALRGLRRKLFGTAKEQPLGPDSDAILYALRAFRRMETKGDFGGAIADYERSMEQPSFLGSEVHRAAATGGILPVAHSLLVAERTGGSLDDGQRASLKRFLAILIDEPLKGDKLLTAAKLAPETRDVSFARAFIAQHYVRHPENRNLAAAEARLCELTGAAEHGLRLLARAYPGGVPKGHRDEKLQRRLRAAAQRLHQQRNPEERPAGGRSEKKD